MEFISVLVLAQEEEVLADLIFAECGWIALKMLGQLAHITDVFLFSWLAIIFKLDELLELGDRWMGSMYHRRERMPLCDDKTARQILTQP